MGNRLWRLLDNKDRRLVNRRITSSKNSQLLLHAHRLWHIIEMMMAQSMHKGEALLSHQVSGCRMHPRLLQAEGRCELIVCCPVHHRVVAKIFWSVNHHWKRRGKYISSFISILKSLWIIDALNVIVVVYGQLCVTLLRWIQDWRVAVYNSMTSR